MKLRLLAAALLLVQLPACSFTMSVENMLSPPRLTAEQEQIYQALQNAAGSNLSLKYPKSGTRLSAFMVEDLDGDGEDEAIVFYESGRSAAEENPLWICLLNQKDGVWSAIRDYPAAGAEIDRVDIEKLGTNPRTNLIIRYSVVDGSNHAAEVFHYDAEAGELVRSLMVHYSQLSLRDLNQDGALELMTVSAAKPTLSAQATVYALDEKGNYYQSPLNLPESFTDVSRVLYGVLPGTGGGLPAVYMDGTAGATTAQTAVLCYRDNRLSLVYTDAPDRFPTTERLAGYASADIDGDGEIEIPVNTNFYGYEREEGSPLAMTNWYVCRNGRLMRKCASYYAVQEGYVFLMPVRWENRVTAMMQDEEIVFYEYDREQSTADGRPVLLAPLLHLQAVTDPISADAMQLENWQLLRQEGGRYYMAKLEKGENPLNLTESEVLFQMQFLTN